MPIIIGIFFAYFIIANTLGRIPDWVWNVALITIFLAVIVFALWGIANDGKEVLEKAVRWWFSGKHPATNIVKRSSRGAAEEFARVLEATHFDDIKARELFAELGPIRQKIWRVRYEERMKAAKRLREMMEAQVAAMHADADLGESILKHERTYHAGRHR